MIQLERYLFRAATSAFLAGLVVLTGVVWVTQALRQIDLITSKGQTILIFLMMTGLALPSMVAIIAPVALFAGILHTLNKLNGDSELVLMAASGVSPARLLRPLALLSGLVFAVVAELYIQVLPWSYGAIERLTTYVHADFIANFARPGAFSQLEAGFVFHFRERTPDGALRGVFMQDQRDPARVMTYIAEAGKTVDRDGASYLQLSKGVLLRPQSAGDSSMVTFDDYTVDLSQFIHALGAIKRPRERSTAQLMAPNRPGSLGSGAGRPYPQRTARPSGEPAIRFRRRSGGFRRSRRSAYDPAGTRRRDWGSGSRVFRPAHARDRGHDARRRRSVGGDIRLVGPAGRVPRGTGARPAATDRGPRAAR